MAAPITAGNNPYENLISQIIQYERMPRFKITDKRNEDERFKAVLSDFDSTLSTLHGQLESFTDPVSHPFEQRGVQTDAESFSVTATDKASFGAHTLQVDRLASTDARLSNQHTSAGTSLRGFFDTNGAQTFKIGVSSPTDADPQNRADISVTVNPTGATDEEILKEIRGAIDTAMEDAVGAETIKSDERASASVINETSDTARLSLRSGSTGYAGRLTFTDSANGLLGQLGLNAGQVASGTGGGQVTAVGTSETDSQLNSKFQLDGLTLYRSTNRVTDALEGLTLDLKQVSEAPEGFEVGPDGDGIKGEVKSFISKYNKVLEFIERKAKVNGETGDRGDFAGESAFTGLRYGLRNDIMQSVTGLPTGSADRLSELGIETEKDGTLKLADEDALLTAVEEAPDAVHQFFAGDDGLATRLIKRLNRFIGSDGLIEMRQDGLDDSIDRLDGRIDAFDERLAQREEMLRDKYAQLQKTLAMMQSQQQSLSFFGGGYYY